MGESAPAPTQAALDELARQALEQAGAAQIGVATAESCTGGGLASLLTSIEGCSSAFDRGFVTYSDSAKQEMLGIPGEMIDRFGAVSRQVAEAMAERALGLSSAAVALAVSGFTGPAGPGEENGLVHFAAASRDGRLLHRERHFGEVGRDEGRRLALGDALELLIEAMPEGPGPN